ncbi:ADP-ribosylglycohydrolase family protein [Actinospica sp.]|jgi:ADP-ribosylglycohydrolase|uniref:ADP-ribosylglycohydrolase family protein n=1 Tax=Actinospica sp. TaxID=1872142 RepID=UPI002C526B94|nr:ADP-ribosylglycohydrolase family protein [Actinospica sp.]HWG27380.1 ADP-ribosylglycohydrolase family protein [Actinospica sp.]
MTVAGSLFGLAYGDALGKDTEFASVAEIQRRYGPKGPADLPEPALVTDDTQMALAVGEGLVEVSGGPLTADILAPVWSRRFVEWAHSPDNNRAPGTTCLRACAGLSEGKPWVEASQAGSKGCGANMRVTPVGLVAGISSSTRAGAAQLQAALTHGHPTGLAASELTAYATWWLLGGLRPEDLPGALRARAEEQREVYHYGWLGDLWKRARDGSAESFMVRGWDECLGVLDRLEAALRLGDRESDPCGLTGEGWIAEEALATALLCFLLFPDDPPAAVRRGATTSGDSDSIAALAGAFAGAAYGIDAFPAGWRSRIEYADRLEAVATGLAASAERLA